MNELSWKRQRPSSILNAAYQDFNAFDSGTGSAENWLISFTTQLRSQLPAGEFIITHARKGAELLRKTVYSFLCQL